MKDPDSLLPFSISDSQLKVVKAGAARLIPLDDITSVMLQFVEANKNDAAHYSCTLIISDSEKLNLKISADNLHQGRSYRQFTLDLHNALHQQKVHPTFIGSGKNTMTIKFSRIFLFCGMGSIIAFAILGIIQNQNYLSGFLFIMFSLLVGFFGINYLNKLVRPSPYDPNQIPDHLVPDD